MSEIDRLNCNNIQCDQGRDILASIYEAMAQLPCNGVQAILCAAAQEIQALRDAQEKHCGDKQELYVFGDETVEIANETEDSIYLISRKQPTEFPFGNTKTS